MYYLHKDNSMGTVYSKFISTNVELRFHTLNYIINISIYINS